MLTTPRHRLIKAMLFSAVLATSPAQATDADHVSAEVQMADLDLSTQQDRRRLEVRIQRAARTLCRTGLRGSEARAAEQACEVQALNSATTQADIAIARANGGARFASIRAARGS